MNYKRSIKRYLVVGITLLIFLNLAVPDSEREYFSPSDIEIDESANRLFVAGRTAREVRSYNLPAFDAPISFSTALPPKSIEISGEFLLVACSYSAGELLILNKQTLKLISRISVGFGACDVVTSKDQSMAYVANQYSDDVSVIDLNATREINRIPVLRQPKQMVISHDGDYLYVANYLPAGRADVDTITSEITVIDTNTEKVLKHIPLANGSNALRGMCISQDGKYVFITHNLGRFQVPTTQLEQGWMNTSALSVIDVNAQEFVATVLLDDPDYGAAGSWGIDCTQDFIFVAHSGTHDISRIEYLPFVSKLKNHPDKKSLAYDLRFLAGIRERVSVNGNGPRAVRAFQSKLYTGNYFTDNISVLDFQIADQGEIRKIALSDSVSMDNMRQGEMYFHDATYCFQGWQSCTGCHPDDARVDGLNWDLLNDGMGNPKNCKSLLLAHKTPPAMITGIRPSAEHAVKAGFEHIQFTNVSEEITDAVNAYLKSLEPVPSPHLLNGTLSAKAATGMEIFKSTGCAECHPAPYYTDQKKHTMGIQGEYDRQNSWDTPSLIEAWRTGPYLHDGRCATMKEIFISEKHGIETDISDSEIDQLVEYVLSL